MRGLPPIAQGLSSRGSRRIRTALRAPGRLATAAAFASMVAALSGAAFAQQQQPFADPNVNMVRGITFPDGDPYMQRQNEPSIAVSTRNPCHLVAGANDYRAVDIPFDDTVPPNSENSLSLAGDAWLGLFKSFDCGQKWQSTLLPGFPQDNSGLAKELRGHAAGADPTVRAGTNGLFYYSGMVFNRGSEGTSKIFVARLVDNNNKERGDPIEFMDVSIVDTGTKGQFLDKPWMAVDVPRNGFGPGSTLASGNASSTGTCMVNGQPIPAGNVYMAWAKFTGSGNQHSKLMFARSTDCGRSWKQNPITNNQQLSQGANIAIAPHDGTIYLTWREFANNGTSKVHFWIATSSDGGQSFSAPKRIGSDVTTFDQLRSNTTFRSNALPAITADHQNRVYVAWSARGYATAPGADGTLQATNDARIVMTVSSDRGRTWGPIFPIDPFANRGHQLMPSLTFAAGKLQAIYYDSREDASKSWGPYIDDATSGVLRHTVDVRGAQAVPASRPVFVGIDNPSLEVSKYRQWQVGPPDNRTSIEVGSNPPNLPMYANGSTPFIGDYIDVSGLAAFPIQTTNGQVWQPNIGPVNLMGASANNISTGGYPTLPVFHATWTDNRDVRTLSCPAPPLDPANPNLAAGQLFGQRNANIYTSRLTPGLFVGSPGNTKPLGYRRNPQTGVDELIQRGFVVFAQNTTDVLKFYELRIMSQPAGGRASFRQFDKNGPLDTIIVSIPRQSTVARTLYATSTDEFAQILVNVHEMKADPVSSNGDGGSRDYIWSAVTGGLRGSILLNPDRTNPKILDPDVDSDVPQIATDEVHDPSMFDAQFFRHTTKSRLLDVKNPDPENPDPENPDPENPDPENPDPENSDPENPDPENPDPENPDPENPDPENPDPENIAVLNTSLSDAEIASASVSDINWRIHNSGNTTSAYRFRPSLPKKFADQKYQLIVTRRSMALTIGPDCQPIYKSQNQVLVNIESFQPRTPDPENPDPENPDPENPDPENPDPENPDPENANFFLAPDETATVTLRVFDLDPDNNEPAPQTRTEVAAKTAAQAANTGETRVTTSVTGPDLTLDEAPATAVPSLARPGREVLVSWTLANRGTGIAVSPSGAIKTTVYLSDDTALDEDDTVVATLSGPATLAHCAAGNTCIVAQSQNVVMPTVAGQYFVIVVVDESAEVFEADELNNRVVVPVRVDYYQLQFTQQPSATTQDYTMTPPVAVAMTHPDGGAVTPADVAGVTLAIQNNASVPPAVLAGTLTRPNMGGSATFSDLSLNRVANGFTLSAAAPLAIGATSIAFNIEPDLPPTTAGESYTTNEDQSLTIAAPGVLGNDSDPPTKGTKPASYTFDAAPQSEPANGSVSVSADGSFVYVPSENFAGSDTFTYRARDGRPGNETLASVAVTVTSINDAPSFTAGANQTVSEDAGAQTVPNWATAISAGPANESAQTIDFIVSNNNHALFAVQPAISSTGTLTYTTAPNAHGTATVTVRIHDDGGIGAGGVDTSAPQTFTVTITAVNDPPVAAADAYTTSEDTPFGVDAGATPLLALLGNDADVDGDGLTVEYLSTTTNGVLSPHDNGSFSYAPNASFFGTDSFTYRVFDGTTSGNTVTVTLNVTAVNDAPAFTKGPDQMVPQNAGAQTVSNWASGVSTGPANEALQTLTFLVSNNNAGIFAVAPAIAANGTLTYTPSATTSGVATVTVQLRDNGGTANGGVDTSAAQTFTITVTAAATTFVVTNTNDSGAGSLRQAILDANLNNSPDAITFNIPGAGVRTITPLSPLPAIVFPVTLNATTQPGFAGSPLIELNGASAGAGANGFLISAQGVTIRGFVVNRFAGHGVVVQRSGAVVAGNYIGTNAAGDAALGNNYGIAVSAPSVIGGTTAADRNVVSGNTVNGVHLQDLTGPGAVVRGNYIGTDAAGAVAVPNGGHGVYIESSTTATVGGDNPNDGNVISGNAQTGVQVYVCPPTASCGGHLIAGNKIGTNATGTAAVPNLVNGIDIYRSPNNTIRGNVISGNGGTPIGGTTGGGIAILSMATADDPDAEQHYGNQSIAGNYIGTAADGLAPIPNLRFGIVLSLATKTRIGGANVADRNIIANHPYGIYVGYAASDNNTIEGNYIGVNANLQPAGNESGIYLFGGSSRNAITGNVIGSNSAAGVVMAYGQAAENTIVGNFIGTDPSGALNLGNGTGVVVVGSANLVSQNRIANSARDGVGIFADPDLTGGSFAGNRVTQNSIYNNGLLGIDLGTAGVNANDAGDGDTGPNNLQNHPTLTRADNLGASTTVLGSLNSTPGTAFTLEFFASAAADASGYGEGQTYLTSVNVTTDGTGVTPINVSLPLQPVGTQITATATDSAGNTSEFSIAVTASSNAAPTATDDSLTANAGAATTFNVLANDTDPNLDGLTIVAVGTPAHGTASIVSPGVAISYTAVAGYEGLDTFTYTISDGNGGSATGTVTVMVATMCAPAPTGLVSWWTADATTNDIVGGNPGVIENGADYAAGRVSQAFSFDGTNQFFEVPDHASLNPDGAFAVGGWFYIDPAAAGNVGDVSTFVGKGDGSPGGGGFYLAFEDRGGAKAAEFAVFGDANLPDPNFELARANNAITTAGWYHLVGVYDPVIGSARTKLFVNGTLAASSTTPRMAAMAANTLPLRIGAMHHNEVIGAPGVNDRLNGKADEVQFYARALSPPEIQAMFEASGAGTCNCAPEPANLLGWWRGENNAADSFGSNPMAETAPVGYAAGRVGSAFSFNGSGYTSTPLNLHGPFTVDFWVKANNPSQPTFTGVLASHNAGDSSEHFQIELDGAGNYRFDGGNLNLALAIGAASTTEFQHIAVSYDGTTVTTFLNGQQVAAGAWSGAPLGFTVVKLGVNRNSSLGFSGLIDEVHVVQRAMSASEIYAIYGGAGFGICSNRPPTSTSDDAQTVSDAAFTGYPSSNDTDPDVASPQVRATYSAFTGAHPPLTFPGEVAIVPSTGKAYFTGNNLSAATDGRFGILDLATNTVTGVIDAQGGVGASMTEVNDITKIVYMRAGVHLIALDANPASSTVNQVVMTVNVGSIQSMAIDTVNNRLYVTATTSAAGLISHGRVVVIDIDPASGTFHQVINDAPVPGTNTGATAIAVNPVTNKVYVGVSGTAAGLYLVNTSTLGMTQIFSSTSTIHSIGVNDLDNLVYAAAGTTLHAVDGTNDTRIAQISLGTTSVNSGQFDTRVAIHRVTGRVFVRLAGFPNGSSLSIVDGKRGSPTFNTLLTGLPFARENGQTAIAVDESANRLITTSPADHRVTILNTTTNALVANVTSTQALERVTVDPATHRAYLGGLGYIQVIDLVTGSVLSTVHVGTELFGLAADPLTHSAYVSQTGLTSAIARIDHTGVIGSVALPHGDGREEYVVRNSTTNTVYALNGGATAAGGANALPGFVHVIDGTSNAITASVPAGPFPFALAVDELNNKIYVGNGSSGAAFPGGISIINGIDNTVATADVSAIPSTNNPPLIGIGRDMVVNNATGKLYFRVTSGAAAQALGVLNGTVAMPLHNFGNVNMIRVNPALNRIYVGATAVGSSTNQVHVLDGATDQLIASLTVGSPTTYIGNQSYIAVNTNTARVFVADFNNHALSVLDGNTNTVVATIPVGRGPSTVAVNTVLNRIYVGNAESRSLTIIDGATLRVVRTLALPIAPVRLELDASMSPTRIYALATASEGKVSVIDDPGTAAPRIISVTQAAHGTVVLNADGSVTYTPDAGYTGSDSYTYSTTDGFGGTTTATANITVLAELDITTPTLPPTQVNSSYFVTLGATGGTGVTTWSVSSGLLPGGLSLTSGGVISGTPRQSGTFTFTLRARDAGTPPQSDLQAYTLVVGPPAVAPFSLPSATVNTPYSQQLFAGGATGAVTWSLDTLGNPGLGWLSLSSDGVLSGTPTVYGNTNQFTVTATDATPVMVSRTYTINVTGPLSMTDLRDGIVLESPAGISFVGGNGGTRTATVVAGTLPPGVTLNANGTWAGTPRRHGTYNVTLELRDCQNSSCTAGITPQVVQKNVQWMIHAKDQQSGQGSDGSISIGGTIAPEMAQVFTVGAHGTLTGISSFNLVCSTPQTAVTMAIQRLTASGVPDGNTIASGTVTSNYGVVRVSPPVPVAIGEKLAFVVSSDVACSLTNTNLQETYHAGDMFARIGGNWVLAATSIRRDFPSFRTLIQPSGEVTYLGGARNSASTTALTSGANAGKALMAGGSLAGEIYDPSAAFAQTPAPTGNMQVQRQGHTATRLTNGQVVMIGGRDAAVSGSPKVASAEFYNGTTFQPANGSMSTVRDNHRAVLFTDPADGREKILVTGGQNASLATLPSVEIYDTVTATFSAGGNMLIGRQAHAAVMLSTGKILIAGGYQSGSGPSAELYDPATGTFTATNGPMVVSNRGHLAATVLANGNVLITGGQSGDVSATAEIYDVAAGTFSATATPMQTPRMQHTATLLPDGSVLIAGGYAEQSLSSYTLALATMERYLPGTGSFVPAGSMATRRERHSAATVTATAAPVPFTGKPLRIDYWYPSSGTVMERTDVTVGPGQEAIHSNAFHVLNVDVSEGNIHIDFRQPHFFEAASFNGFRFHDYTGSIGAFTSVTINPATNMAGLDASRISFTADEIFINWQGLSFDANTVVSLDVATTSQRILLTGGTSQGWMSANTAEIYDPATTPSMTPTTFANGSVGAGYSQTLTGQGGAGGPYTFGLAGGQLPAGLSLTGATVSGTPTSIGRFTFAISVTDAAGRFDVQSFSITVGSVNTINTGYGPHTAPQNTAFSLQLTASGPKNVWSLLPASNPLPPGITLSNTGLLSGSATATGYYNFGVRAVDNNGTGTEATKVLAISVISPMTITTTSLGNGDLFSNNLACISTSGNSNGNRTYSVISGTLPPGLALSGTNNCFTGTMTATGAYTFTVRVTDQSTPTPQQATQSYTVNVWAADQSSNASDVTANLSFGTATGVRIAERIYTGITGTLRAVRLPGLVCNAAGTAISAEIQGLDAAGRPDGVTLAMGTATTNTVVLNTGLFFASDAAFAVVFDASAQCHVKPQAGDSYPGEGFVSNGGGPWQQLQTSPDGRHDIPVLTLVEPAQGLVPMSLWRGQHTQTLLPNGTVLLAGGYVASAAAEIYSPASDTMAPTTGSMSSVRQGNTATMLSNGKVLITGGLNGSGQRLATAELYDPATGLFSATGTMAVGRLWHTATPIGNGKVLIAGGQNELGNAVSTAEIYDEGAGTFTSIASMTAPRYEHTATLLGNGKVLLAAGYFGGSSAELFDPISQTFQAIPGGMGTARGRHTATLLDDGTVLIVGGTGNAGEAMASAEFYDPNAGASGAFSVAGTMATPRYDHAAVMLPDGSVLVSGGLTDATCCYPKAPVATMERFLSGTGWVQGPSMIAARYAHAMTLVDSTRLLIGGTFGWSSAAGRTAETFDPDAMPPYLTTTVLPNGTSNAPYTYTLQATGGAGGPYVIEHLSGALPDGSSFNPSTFAIGPQINNAQTGIYTMTFRVTDAASRASVQMLTLRVDAVIISTTALPTAYQNVAYSGTLSGTATTPITWSVVSGALPAGLTLNASSGAITGAATNSCCNAHFVVRATDAFGQWTQTPLSISVQPALQISTTTIGDGFAGSTYFGGVFATGGTAPLTWSLSNHVPMGLSIDPATGQFNASYPADVIREGGVFSLTANVLDSTPGTPQSASRNLTLKVYSEEQVIPSGSASAVAVPSTRRIAQVLTSNTPFDLQGVRPWSMSCGANVTLTARIYPVAPGDVPDESGPALATGAITANGSGFFTTPNVIFTAPVPMPRGTRFAVVYSASGACSVANWPASDFYSGGNAWINDGGSWLLANAEIARGDLPMSTLVFAAPSMRFLAGYRGGHVTAALPNGKIFLAGAEHYTEVYDPASHAFTLGPNMNHARQEATATLLDSGKVLVAGGSYWDGTATIASATTQIYNPVANSFEPSQNMNEARFRHTATKLSNGNVVLIGGEAYGPTGNQTTRSSIEVLDGAGQWLASHSMTGERAEHTATLLPSGKILIVGGWYVGSAPAAVAEIFNPANGTITTVSSSVITWPSQHTATLLTTGPHAGEVLITGGQAGASFGSSYYFDPVSETFSNAGILLTPRSDHTATQLPNGRIVFAGGVKNASDWSSTPSVEIFDPVTENYSAYGEMFVDRNTHRADLVTIGATAAIVLSGGFGSGAMTGRSLEVVDVSSALGTFNAASAMSLARRGHAAVQLGDGTVLLAGNDTFTTTAEIYDPSAGTATPTTGTMSQGRCNGCAYVKLLNGKVLITGGWNGGAVFSSAELYDPATGQFSATANTMSVPRLEHSAVTLDNGKVLILGGYDGTTPHASAELFDPVTQTFSSTGGMSAVRYRATAVKLANGKVLVTGGYYGPTNTTVVTTTEIYDPANGTFSVSSSMVTPRLSRATLLADGRVLYTGGWSGSAYLQDAEVYSPGSGTFSVIGSMTSVRTGHFALRIANGSVVIGGGHDGTSALNTAEIFNPATNTFTRISNLPAARDEATAIVLDDGRIMITGGLVGGVVSNRVDFYVP